MRRFLFLFHKILIVLIGLSSVTLKSMFSLENKKRDVLLCPDIHKAVQAVVQFFFFVFVKSYNNLCSNKNFFLSLQRNSTIPKIRKSSHFIRQRRSQVFQIQFIYFLEHALQGLFVFSFLACTRSDQSFTFALRLLLLMETPAEISTGYK